MLKIKSNQIIILIFILGLFQGVLSTYFKLSVVIYFCDFLSVLVWFFSKQGKRKVEKGFYIPVILFSVVIVIAMIINAELSIMTFWGVRIYYRFFSFLFACCCFLDVKDYQGLVKLYEFSFWPHLVLTLYQYFIQGLNQDFLGGIWGVQKGSNAGLCIYLTGLLVISIYRYYRKQIGIPTLLFYSLLMCINAAMAELKFFFVILMVLYFVFILLSRKLSRTLGVIIIAVICISVASYALGRLYPQYDNFFDPHGLIQRVVGSDTYSEENDIGRSAVFEKLTPIIKNWTGSNLNLYFGIGLGNADYSTEFPPLSSPFYELYGGLHYTWVSMGYLFVETGYFGVITYLLLFIVILIKSIYRYKIKKEDKYLFEILLITAFLMIIFYNSSMRTNYAYIAFFLMAIPFISKSDDGEMFLDKKKIITFD